MRISVTASDASELIPALDLDDLQNLAYYANASPVAAASWPTCCSRALAGRLAGDGIVVHSMHPGAVDSNFFNRLKDARARMRELRKVSVADTPW